MNFVKVELSLSLRHMGKVGTGLLDTNGGELTASFLVTLTPSA
jgi:hypothetical protein